MGQQPGQPRGLIASMQRRGLEVSSNTSKALAARTGLGILSLTIPVIGAARVLRLPLSPGKVGMLLLTLAPAVLFLIMVRGYRGALIFGSILLTITMVGWLSVLTSSSEFAGLSVVYASLLAFVVVIVGAAIDANWRKS
jgi:hypothetical protein